MPTADPPPQVRHVRRAHRLLLVLVLCGPLSTVFAGSLRGFGPYWFYLEKLYKCDRGESNNKISVDAKVTKFDVRRPNELQTVYGQLNMTTTFSERNWYSLVLDLDSNGRWKPNALVFRSNDAGCSSLKTHLPGLFHLLMGRRDCPFPVGVIDMNGPVNWTIPKFPVLPFGHYRVHMKTGVAKDTDLCHIFEAYIVPRKH